MKRLVHFLCLIAALWCGFLATGCGGKGGTQGEAADSLEMRLHDTIVVGTLYSPTSYFIYRGDPMGYHYDLIQKFAKDTMCISNSRLCATWLPFSLCLTLQK